MMCKLLLVFVGFFYHHGNANPVRQEEFVPTRYGPQSFKEDDIARKALYGPYNGGDMILPEDFNISNAGQRNEKYRWPGYPGGATIPYVIDSSLAESSKVIMEGIEEYHKKTCIKFVPRTNEKDYIRIFYGTGCWSVLGRAGGEQKLSLGRGCAYKGLVIHELGHAIGLMHEHVRSDRDKHLIIYRENVKPDKLHNFGLVHPSNELIFTEYDYDSIMHYGNYAFSTAPRKLPTMEARNGQKLYEPYEKKGFTVNDLITIKLFYNC